MANLNGIQERLKTYKEQEDLTYAELGKLIGVSKAIAFDICNKRRRFLQIEVIDKMIKLLGENDRPVRKSTINIEPQLF
jgi:transcriptional regulator with XRE-family HTH domain